MEDGLKATEELRGMVQGGLIFAFNGSIAPGLLVESVQA